MTDGDGSARIAYLPQNRVLRHILFWIVIYIIDVLIFGFGHDNVRLFMKIALLETPPQIFFAYVMMYWIIPRHLRTNKPLDTVGLTVVAFVISGFLGHVLFLLFSGYPPEIGLWNVAKIMVRGLYSALKGGVAIGIKLAMLWYANEKRVAAMEKNKLESELKMLKDQVNPHFLFNTLNNLYGLINRSPLQAQESILRLSGILHFMLHECNRPVLPMHSEIRCIGDYIELEKLRYADTLSVSINVQDNVKDLGIAPLMLFPFVENSFKHGASELIHDSWINLDFSVYKNDFIFKIENSKPPLAHNVNSSRIGLNNVKRRLELVYQQDHLLQIIDGTDSFLVVLKIALSRMGKAAIAKYESEVSYR